MCLPLVLAYWVIRLRAHEAKDDNGAEAAGEKIGPTGYTAWQLRLNQFVGTGNRQDDAQYSQGPAACGTPPKKKAKCSVEGGMSPFVVGWLQQAHGIGLGAGVEDADDE